MIKSRRFLRVALPLLSGAGLIFVSSSSLSAQDCATGYPRSAICPQEGRDEILPAAEEPQIPTGPTQAQLDMQAALDDWFSDPNNAINTADDDGDGLSDAIEIVIGGDPMTAEGDTDNNSINDAMDQFLADNNITIADLADALSDTLGMDVNEDPDNDGLSTLQELLQGSNPLDEDTDDDGAVDGVDSQPLNQAFQLWHPPVSQDPQQNQKTLEGDSPSSTGVLPPWFFGGNDKDGDGRASGGASSGSGGGGWSNNQGGLTGGGGQPSDAVH